MGVCKSVPLGEYRSELKLYISSVLYKLKIVCEMELVNILYEKVYQNQKSDVIGMCVCVKNLIFR